MLSRPSSADCQTSCFVMPGLVACFPDTNLVVKAPPLGRYRRLCLDSPMEGLARLHLTTQDSNSMCCYPSVVITVGAMSDHEARMKQGVSQFNFRDEELPRPSAVVTISRPGRL
jgi:hypothetical protein